MLGVLKDPGKGTADAVTAVKWLKPGKGFESRNSNRTSAHNPSSALKCSNGEQVYSGTSELSVTSLFGYLQVGGSVFNLLIASTSVEFSARR